MFRRSFSNPRNGDETLQRLAGELARRVLAAESRTASKLAG
jgi:hypothetical protein